LFAISNSVIEKFAKRAVYSKFLLNIVEKRNFWTFQGSAAALWGEVGKFTTTSRQIFTGCCVPQIIKIAQFLTELFPKQKGGRFFETQCSRSNLSSPIHKK